MCLEQNSNYCSCDIVAWQDSDRCHRWECAHTLMHVFPVSAGRPLILQAETSDSRLDERPCGWSEGGNARRDACDWVMVGRVMEGYWVDDCPPFVLQIRGNLLAIVALCLFTSQKAESGDFSSTEPMTSRLFFFFFKSSSVGFSLALLSSLPFFFFLFFLTVCLLCSGYSA